MRGFCAAEQRRRSGGAGTGTELHRQILEASLPLVTELGWSVEALAAGAESLGLPDVAHGMFPHGGVELVHHFYAACNIQLVAEMAERRDNEQTSDSPAPLGTQAFIRWAVERRLRMVAPYLARWPEALALLRT
ncbi:ubiquinone biosynthesis protein COQ9, mitochondrial-like [Pollicipes pollicipes]|uniref:ubiquinone biosynthesis protein COQ9, mitochondrial-like n=1 Tax=Pollicipes pollicipes TaxID=41117 RepID=UPI0018853502|nr:ubiquinone biosynthesis protein COQ9, mitochondrial-like [Pollicipes pollicipes]